MSTRANIIVTDAYGDALTFYRHSDGYPEGAMPILEKFLEQVKSGAIRDNVGQAAGWLILFGAIENDTIPNMRDGIKDVMNWKVGSIEPTPELHGDIEYLYAIDLGKKTIKTHEVKHDANYDVIIPKGLPKQYYKKNRS